MNECTISVIRVYCDTLKIIALGKQTRNFLHFLEANTSANACPKSSTLLRTFLSLKYAIKHELPNCTDTNLLSLLPILLTPLTLMTIRLPFQNMFLAIINDTYSEVKNEISAQKNEFEIADYFKRGYNNMMGKGTTSTNAATS